MQVPPEARSRQARPDLAGHALQTLSLPGAFALGAAQMADRRVIRVLAKSALVSLALLALVFWGGFAAFDAGIEWLAGTQGAWIAGLGQLVAVIAAVLCAWLAWRIVAMAVLNFHADEIVSLVEERHYPAFKPRDIPLGEEIAMALKGAARALAFNALALPVALALAVTGVGTAIVFITVNAFLLGRELQDMVWARHPQGNDPIRGTDPASPRRKSRGIAPLAASTRFLLGLAVVGLLAIPVANLLAPFLGAAAATHLVHRAAARRAGNSRDGHDAP
ncbi:EI24 domain-containing protein [Croceicoccus marinus]|uniref:EI24 domain-containing protein n=1 Tax=Croceicoccus marinus TaxID=450378 RepID=A0A7G6VV74_9SPHN|nr:EI24 domain-containing protein [Croceicoccus marinus]QNE05639.1 EI24 domain-containing protein [Croceicoccus marinus]